MVVETCNLNFVLLVIEKGVSYQSNLTNLEFASCHAAYCEKLFSIMNTSGFSTLRFISFCFIPYTTKNHIFPEDIFP